jgi:hypothetical protein
MKQTTLFWFVALLLLSFTASAQTTIAATPERAVGSSPSATLNAPHAAQNANGVSLVVWVENNNAIMGQRVDPNSNVIGPAFRIAQFDNPAAIAVASNGLSYLVVYGSQDFLGQYVTADGKLRGTPFAAGHTFTPGFDASLHWNGFRYLLVLADTFAARAGSGTEYIGWFIEQLDGVVSPPFVIESRAAGAGQSLPRLECAFSAGPAGKSLAACRDDNVVFADIVFNDGSHTGPLFIASSGRLPRAAWSGINWVVGWLNDTKLSRASVNADGTVAASFDTPMETGITTSNGTYQLGSARDGVLYAGGDNAVYAAKLDPNGNLSTGPTLLASGTGSSSSLAGGPAPLVTYRNSSGIVYRTLSEASTLPKKRVVR